MLVFLAATMSIASRRSRFVHADEPGEPIFSWQQHEPDFVDAETESDGAHGDHGVEEVVVSCGDDDGEDEERVENSCY